MLNQKNQEYADVLWRLRIDEAPEFIVIIGKDGEIRFSNNSVECSGFKVDEELPFLVGSTLGIRAFMMVLTPDALILILPFLSKGLPFFFH